MKPAIVRAYTSPTLVLLALDWPEGAETRDFLGFAIRRKPGLRNIPGNRHWLPNRIGFFGPAKRGEFPSSKAPIQKFLWWDARIDPLPADRTYTYEVFPVLGKPRDLKIQFHLGSTIRVELPLPEAGGIGTYFNRAVVSSQAFARKFGGMTKDQIVTKALPWLANGLEKAIPEFLRGSPAVKGAIYHLEDRHWIIPSIRRFLGPFSLVFNRTSKDKSNDGIVAELKAPPRRTFHPRTRASIMHNKFLVRTTLDGRPESVLTGSANFTTSGLTQQANLLHTFRSPELAALYHERQVLLAADPTISKTALHARWSEPVAIGRTRVRVHFSPEPTGSRESIDTIVEAIRRAKSSVVFCLFMPTDKPLRDAAFEAGDRKLMMFGLVNSMARKAPEPGTGPGNAAKEARVEIYHRSRKNRDVFAHNYFRKGTQPNLFWFETDHIPALGRPEHPVWIHHKFVVIDAETADPVIYSGSANMSRNSLQKNDENLLEIRGNPALAQAYLAEFLRLYEHYRARVLWDRDRDPKSNTFRLRTNRSWADAHYTPDTLEYRSRIAMAAPLSNPE